MNRTAVVPLAFVLCAGPVAAQTIVPDSLSGRSVSVCTDGMESGGAGCVADQRVTIDLRLRGPIDGAVRQELLGAVEEASMLGAKLFALPLSEAGRADSAVVAVVDI